MITSGSGHYCNPNLVTAASFQDDQEPGKHIPINNSTIVCVKLIESGAIYIMFISQSAFFVLAKFSKFLHPIR